METISIETRIKTNTEVGRLMDYIESINVSIGQFEQTIGVREGYFRQQSNSSSSIATKVLLRISMNYTQLNILWVITGKHNMTLHGNEDLLSLAS